MEQVKRRHTREIIVQKETSRKNKGSLINGVKVANAHRVRISIDKDLILAFLRIRASVADYCRRKCGVEDHVSRCHDENVVASQERSFD